jgi:hypothetical protein
MSINKKYYYIIGGTVEDLINKIKISDFVIEGTNNVLSISDIKLKKEIYVTLSNHIITNISGITESKPKIFQMKYLKNGNKYLNIYYEFLHIESHQQNNLFNSISDIKSQYIELNNVKKNNLTKNTKYIQTHSTKFITKIINLTEEDVLIIKTTIKKIIKSNIFKQIFEYTDLKENLEHLFI